MFDAEDIEGVPVLLQVSDSGNQTNKTLLEAIETLSQRFDEIHKDEMHLFQDKEGRRLELIWMTDGHGSRYALEILKRSAELRCEPLIRLANSSAVTQMLDRIFQFFHAMYTYLAKLLESRYRQEHKDINNMFKYNKQTVVHILRVMHEHGVAMWAPRAKVLDAWSKVGYNMIDGMNVEMLVSHPMVRKTVVDADVDVDDVIRQDFANPSAYKEGTMLYMQAERAHLKAQVESFKTNPHTIAEALMATNQNVPISALAIFGAGALSAKTPGSARGTQVRVTLTTGLIARNAHLKQVQADSVFKKEKSAANKVQKVEDQRTIYTQWQACTEGACSCGAATVKECFKEVYFYCEDCFHKKKAHYMKKTLCGVADCKWKRYQNQLVPGQLAIAWSSADPAPPTNVAPTAAEQHRNEMKVEGAKQSTPATLAVANPSDTKKKGGGKGEKLARPIVNPLPPNWASNYDTVHSRDYYYHIQTKEVRWERPTAVADGAGGAGGGGGGGAGGKTVVAANSKTNQEASSTLPGSTITPTGSGGAKRRQPSTPNKSKEGKKRKVEA